MTCQLVGSYNRNNRTQARAGQECEFQCRLASSLKFRLPSDSSPGFSSGIQPVVLPPCPNFAQGGNPLMPDINEDAPDDLGGLPRRPGRTTGAPAAVVRSGKDAISVELALTIFRQMVRTRALEERGIKMSKSGEAYFWVGGPGEEAVNACLGMQVRRGQGPAYDYLHLHYRNSGVMLAMGMPVLEQAGQLAMTATDRHSRGRNFVGHYAMPEWNVLPVTSVIEVQMVMAPGTALVQKRHGGEGLSVAFSGDAGTAEGDFESCLL